MAQVLVAEHNKEIASYLTGALKQAGHNSMLTDNSLDSWRVSGEMEFDILIVDITMPDMDGFVLAQKALQANPYLNVIFVTGFAAVAMDTYNSPDYAPRPMTSVPFHLKDVMSRVHYMLGDTASIPQTNQNFSLEEDRKNVIYADFKKRRYS